MGCPYGTHILQHCQQKRATMMFLRQQRGAMSYEDRLKTLNWQTLESRRQRLIVQFTTKFLFGLNNCPTINLNTSVNTRYIDTLVFNHLYARYRTLSLKNTSIHYFPRVWSGLPTNITNSLTLESYKCFTCDNYMCMHFQDL